MRKMEITSMSLNLSLLQSTSDLTALTAIYSGELQGVQFSINLNWRRPFVPSQKNYLYYWKMQMPFLSPSCATGLEYMGTQWLSNYHTKSFQWFTSATTHHCKHFPMIVQRLEKKHYIMCPPTRLFGLTSFFTPFQHLNQGIAFSHF